MAETVQRFDYAGRSKADKGLLRRFPAKATDRLLHELGGGRGRCPIG